MTNFGSSCRPIHSIKPNWRLLPSTISRETIEWTWLKVQQLMTSDAVIVDEWINFRPPNQWFLVILFLLTSSYLFLQWNMFSSQARMPHQALQNWNPAAQRSNEESLFRYFEEITGRLFFSQAKFANLLENSYDYSYEYYIYKCIEVCS